ncbi:MAG: c-type cytochrome [Opitutae bacterium]|nr:c-type cytochrome [Opitutae bacterium]
MPRPALLLLAGGLLPLSVLAAPPAPDADDGAINLPPGFRALVVADNLVAGRKVNNTVDKLRFITVAPNGDLYAKTYFGGILALRDTDGDGRYDERHEFGRGGGTGIALHDGWLYHSTNDDVFRYRITPGELVPSGPPELVVGGLPNGGNHAAKVFAFDDAGHLLVEIGSPANVYADGDRTATAKGKDATEYLKTHGGFWRFDADRSNQTFADGRHMTTGHRHVLSLAWQPTARAFYFVMMGRDRLSIVAPEFYDDLDNAERVAEEMHELREGLNVGWPYTYWDPIKQARMVAPEFGGDNRKRDDNPLYGKPVIAFPAHWAPLQMTTYTGAQFPAHYRGGFFVALHGSWNRAPRSQAGYKIVFVPCDDAGRPTGAYETFADGFSGLDEFTDPGAARFRPGGVAVGPDGSLYVSETEKGRIWRILYTGETSPAGANKTPGAPGAQTVPTIGADTPGGKIYLRVCAACHMPNGGGVPSMQPPLAGSPVVAGDTRLLLNVILQGPAAVLPADRPKFGNVMPPFGAVYTDAEIASLANYLRANFASGAPTVTPDEVKALRPPQP